LNLSGRSRTPTGLSVLSHWFCVGLARTSARREKIEGAFDSPGSKEARKIALTMKSLPP
jgi:hypothetical protein